MKRWLKDHLPTRLSINKSRQLQSVKWFLKSSDLWSYKIQPVARGVAAGFAGAVIPGFQFLYAAILAILLRGNIPIALVSTFITNPFTTPPILYFIYWIGSLILENNQITLKVHPFKWGFSTIHQFLDNFSTWILQFGKAFLVGVPIVSLCLGIIGYFGTLLVWKIYLLQFRKEKHKNKQ